MLFVATAKDKNGETRTLTREAVSSSQFAAALRSEGFVVLSVVERSAAVPPPRRTAPFFSRMSNFGVEMGLRQLASMLSSGVTLLLALRTVAEQASSRRARAIWESVANEILRGGTFAAALGGYRKVFGEITVRLVEAGERSGELERSLRCAAEQLECARSLRTAVVNALVYPALTLVMTLGVSVYLVSCVIPKLGEFISSAGGELPAITAALLDCSEWFRGNSQFLAAGAAGAVLLWLAVRLFERGRETEDALLLRLPVAGGILRVAGTAIFARSVQIMTESGVTLIDALDTAAKIVVNRRLRRRAEAAREAIIAGGSLADSLAPAVEFMPMMKHMAAVGEMSGSLPEAFGETARLHELILSITIKRLGILIEPVMIAVTGVIVGFVYIAFFMALFAIALAG